jgi:hypothetical protein
VRGTQRRAALELYIRSGRLAEAPELIVRDVLTPEERTSLGREHPSFMGGEYLSARHEREVEIARITIASVTSDVTSVYARSGGGRIYYRVVDEYEGETLRGTTNCTSDLPLTLAELGEFFLAAWPLLDVIVEGGGLVDPLSFARGESAFYPYFGDHIQRTVEEWVQARVPKEDELETRFP